MKIGFVGTGAIAEAMILGMFRHGNVEQSVLVSRRSEIRSTRLANKFQWVEVVADNQVIVDTVDWVFVSVLPDQAEQIFCELNFRAEQTIISLVAGFDVETIRQWVGVNQVHRIIPLPPIEFGVGPIPLFPSNVELESFLNKFGTAIAVDAENQFTTFSAASASMATFFEFVSTISNWMVQQGATPAASEVYATTMINALSTLTLQPDAQPLAELSEECLTAGGLNEQVLRECKAHDWFEVFHKRLDNIIQRLNSNSIVSQSVESSSD